MLSPVARREGTLWTARSIIPLTDRTKPATSPTPFVIFDALEIFARPSSTSLLMGICRLVGLWSSAEMLVAQTTPGLAPRTLPNVFTYDVTSSALLVLSLSYTAFHSVSDTERTAVGGSMDSVGGGLGADSASRARGSARDAAGGWRSLGTLASLSGPAAFAAAAADGEGGHEVGRPRHAAAQSHALFTPSLANKCTSVTIPVMSTPW